MRTEEGYITPECFSGDTVAFGPPPMLHLTDPQSCPMKSKMLFLLLLILIIGRLFAPLTTGPLEKVLNHTSAKIAHGR